MPFVDGLMSAVTLTLTLTFTLTFTVRVCRAVGGAGPEWSDSDGCLTGGNAELMVPAAACASNPPGPMLQVLPKAQGYDVLFLDGGRLAP